MTTPTFEDAVSRIVRKDPRFAERAYSFLKDALDFTMQRVEERENGSQRHVSGQELLEGFRDYALAQFGPMASTVMKEWGLRNGKNVGEMVFLLIEEDVFSKQPEDSLDDFKGFMSFRKAFEEPYEFQDLWERGRCHCSACPCMRECRGSPSSRRQTGDAGRRSE